MSIPSFSYASTNESLLTGGLESFSPLADPIAFQGMDTGASPAPAVPNASEQVSAPPLIQSTSDTSALPQDTILDANGDLISIGSAFNPMSSALAHVPSSSSNPALQNGLDPGGLYAETSYTGSNLKVLLEIAGTPASGNSRQYKQLVELTTITVSVHRVKSPAVAMGYINAKGWARGRRTIAGTVVLTRAFFPSRLLATFGIRYGKRANIMAYVSDRHLLGSALPEAIPLPCFPAPWLPLLSPGYCATCSEWHSESAPPGSAVPWYLFPICMRATYPAGVFDQDR